MGWLTAFAENVYPPSLSLGAVDARFGIENARTMAWASQLAYEVDDESKVERITTAWGWKVETLLKGRVRSTLPLTHTKGFIASNAGHIVIAFCGTEPTDLANWITNFSFVPADDGIHGGFEAAVEAVWANIKSHVDGSKPICIAGHSLGGALAAICALRMVSEKILTADKLLGVYTIGMPRTGTAAFVQKYDDACGGALADRTWRLIHGYDIVPTVPPRQPPFSFRHVGHELRCAHGGQFDAMTVSAIGADQNLDVVELVGRRFIESLYAGPPTDLPAFPGANPTSVAIMATLPPPIRDHIPDRYLRALQAI